MSEPHSARSLSPEVSDQLVRLALGLPEAGEALDLATAVRSQLRLEGHAAGGALRFEEVRREIEQARSQAQERAQEQSRSASSQRGTP